MALKPASARPGRARLDARTIILLVAAALFIILLIQNRETITIRFFFWTIGEFPIVILAPVLFFLGFFTGYWRAHFGRRRAGRSADGQAPPPPAQIAGR
ncbi:MAG: LapA family protein [Acidobacteriota bacterium]|nr:LapA family protein [Acidobacteriota bacterium]